MRKFIVLSILAAIAGVTVGIIRHQGTNPTAVAAGIEVSSTTTTEPTPSTAVTAAKTVGTAKVTTTTRPKAAAIGIAPTTTTRPVATTATTQKPTAATTPTPQQIVPTCSTSATPAAAGSYIDVLPRRWEDVRIASNMPKTRTRLTVQYPSLQQQFWLETDTSGAAKKIFQLQSSGTTSLSVDFYDAAENHVGASPACQSTFEAPKPE